MPLNSPRFSEANVAETYTGPHEEIRETRKGEQPVEDLGTHFRLVDERQETESDLQDDTPDGTALLVNVGECLGGHSVHCECLDGTGGSKGARVGDTDDGEGDDGIENGGKPLNTGQLDGDDKRRKLGVCAGRVEQVLVVGRYNQAHKQETDHVEKGNPPEHLLGRGGKRFPGIGGFGGCEADQLRASEGECGGDEDGAKSLETIAERARLIPILAANVSARIRLYPTAIDHDSEDDEAEDGKNLDDAEKELDCSIELVITSSRASCRGLQRSLTFAVASNAENLNGCQDKEEDGNPDSDVDVCSPILDRDTGRCDFEGQDNEPTQGVIPAHCETPVLSKG